MSSQAQIDANRRNSQRSTGPTSPEGKAVCAQNALKSGIYAFSHLIRGEDPDELDALKAAFLEHHKPADPTQLALVDALIATEWTQRRIESTNRMFLHTLKALQDLRKASADQTGQQDAPTQEPESGEQPQQPTSPFGSVPPIPSAPAPQRRRSHENHGSSLTERPALLQQAPPTAARPMKTAQHCRQRTHRTRSGADIYSSSLKWRPPHAFARSCR